MFSTWKSTLKSSWFYSEKLPLLCHISFHVFIVSLESLQRSCLIFILSEHTGLTNPPHRRQRRCCLTPLSSSIPFVFPPMPPLALWSQLQAPPPLDAWAWVESSKRKELQLVYFQLNKRIRVFFSVKERDNICAALWAPGGTVMSLAISSHSIGIIMTNIDRVVQPHVNCSVLAFIFPISISFDL